MGNNLAIMMVIISKKKLSFGVLSSCGCVNCVLVSEEGKRNFGKTEKEEENLGISEKIIFGGKTERVMGDW